jgi:hypothetical protein
MQKVFFHKKQLFSQKNQKIAQNCKKWANFGVLLENFFLA